MNNMYAFSLNCPTTQVVLDPKILSIDNRKTKEETKLNVRNKVHEKCCVLVLKKNCYENRKDKNSDLCDNKNNNKILALSSMPFEIQHKFYNRQNENFETRQAKCLKKFLLTNNPTLVVEQPSSNFILPLTCNSTATSTNALSMNHLNSNRIPTDLKSSRYTLNSAISVYGKSMKSPLNNSLYEKQFQNNNLSEQFSYGQGKLIHPIKTVSHTSPQNILKKMKDKKLSALPLKKYVNDNNNLLKMNCSLNSVNDGSAGKAQKLINICNNDSFKEQLKPVERLSSADSVMLPNVLRLSNKNMEILPSNTHDAPSYCIKNEKASDKNTKVLKTRRIHDSCDFILPTEPRPSSPLFKKSKLIEEHKHHVTQDSHDIAETKFNVFSNSTTTFDSSKQRNAVSLQEFAKNCSHSFISAKKAVKKPNETKIIQQSKACLSTLSNKKKSYLISCLSYNSFFTSSNTLAQKVQALNRNVSLFDDNQINFNKNWRKLTFSRPAMRFLNLAAVQCSRIIRFNKNIPSKTNYENSDLVENTIKDKIIQKNYFQPKFVEDISLNCDLFQNDTFETKEKINAQKIKSRENHSCNKIQKIGKDKEVSFKQGNSLCKRLNSECNIQTKAIQQSKIISRETSLLLHSNQGITKDLQVNQNMNSEKIHLGEKKIRICTTAKKKECFWFSRGGMLPNKSIFLYPPIDLYHLDELDEDNLEEFSKKTMNYKKNIESNFCCFDSKDVENKFFSSKSKKSDCDSTQLERFFIKGNEVKPKSSSENPVPQEHSVLQKKNSCQIYPKVDEKFGCSLTNTNWLRLSKHLEKLYQDAARRWTRMKALQDEKILQEKKRIEKEKEELFGYSKRMRSMRKRKTVDYADGMNRCKSMSLSTPFTNQENINSIKIEEKMQKNLKKNIKLKSNEKLKTEKENKENIDLLTTQGTTFLPNNVKNIITNKKGFQKNNQSMNEEKKLIMIGENMIFSPSSLEEICEKPLLFYNKKNQNIHKIDKLKTENSDTPRKSVCNFGSQEEDDRESAAKEDFNTFLSKPNVFNFPGVCLNEFKPFYATTPNSLKLSMCSKSLYDSLKSCDHSELSKVSTNLLCTSTYKCNNFPKETLKIRCHDNERINEKKLGSTSNDKIFSNLFQVSPVASQVKSNWTKLKKDCVFNSKINSAVKSSIDQSIFVLPKGTKKDLSKICSINAVKTLDMKSECNFNQIDDIKCYENPILVKSNFSMCKNSKTDLDSMYSSHGCLFNALTNNISSKKFSTLKSIVFSQGPPQNVENRIKARNKAIRESQMASINNCIKSASLKMRKLNQNLSLKRGKILSPFSNQDKKSDKIETKQQQLEDLKLKNNNNKISNDNKEKLNFINRAKLCKIDNDKNSNVVGLGEYRKEKSPVRTFLEYKRFSTPRHLRNRFIEEIEQESNKKQNIVCFPELIDFSKHNTANVVKLPEKVSNVHCDGNENKFQLKSNIKGSGTSSTQGTKLINYEASYNKCISVYDIDKKSSKDFSSTLLKDSSYDKILTGKRCFGFELRHDLYKNEL